MRTRTWFPSAASAVVLVAAVVVASSSGGEPEARSRSVPDVVTARTTTVEEPVPVPWEGGPAYYRAFPAAEAAGWADPAFFPRAVWFESVVDRAGVDLDRAAGLNTYVELTADSDLDLVRAAGMFAVPSAGHAGVGPETVGWLVADEPDMWAGPGAGEWTGNYPGQGEICAPVTAKCGYTVLDRVRDRLPKDDGRLRYANFGKGVMFWESDSEAGPFLNGRTDLTSADVYWYTDPNVCDSPSEGPLMGIGAAHCRRAANYGTTMDRMRKLDADDGHLQPLWAFVEVGHPFTEHDAPTITGDQLAGAVVNSLIHEARGIVYFNHSFGGPCVSQHVLRDSCGAAVRPSVTRVNEQIAHLAPVLNTQSHRWEFNGALDTMLKEHDGSRYVFAMLKRRTAPGTHVLTLPPDTRGSTAEVLFENRTVPVVDGTITDELAAESSYHVYKITP
ncbi:hypothetical protein [Umezawaea beigongshangensis]|uniref:hypothetical protein n=1 Tax=Umezawaea beigongshangensis TaxID=2780383 RepID=UPI0018F12F32|nr:hypothetical protein [Umezawaea beigongshangensis]